MREKEKDREDKREKKMEDTVKCRQIDGRKII
jgi:hypothetical protein